MLISNESGPLPKVERKKLAEWINTAWDERITEDMIKNTFRHIGFF
jgi:hypothetical protein